MKKSTKRNVRRKKQRQALKVDQQKDQKMDQPKDQKVDQLKDQKEEITEKFDFGIINMLPRELYAIFLEYVEEIQVNYSARNYRLAKFLDPRCHFGYAIASQFVYIDEEIKQHFGDDYCMEWCSCHNHVREDEVAIIKVVSVPRLLPDMSIFKTAHTMYIGTNEVMSTQKYERYEIPDHPRLDYDDGEIAFSNSLRDLTIEILVPGDYELKLPNSLRSLTIKQCEKSRITLSEGLTDLEIGHCNEYYSITIENFPDSLKNVTIYGTTKYSYEAGYPSDAESDDIEYYGIPERINFTYDQFPKCSCGKFKQHGHYC
jgi:hypothetical protein